MTLNCSNLLSLAKQAQLALLGQVILITQAKKETIMKTFTVKSQNGSRGLSVVSENPKFSEGTIVEGAAVKSLGTRAGYESYEVLPAEGSWVWVEKGNMSFKPLFGAKKVTEVDLCGGYQATILALGPKALVQWFGYKGRTSGFYMITEGARESAPAALLLKMGLIKPAEGSVKPPEECLPPGLSEEQVKLLKSLGL